MREIFEFRVVEEFADRLFEPDDGTRLGSSIRLVRIADNDPRLPKIGEISRAIRRESNRSFFHGWQIVRKYSKAELNAALLLHLKITSVFEPAGEQCGTEYDESTACPKCGAGAVQVSDLWLDMRKLPKRKEIARTIVYELIVSQHLAERMTDAGLTGYELRPVKHKARYQDDPVYLRRVPTGQEILRRAEAAAAPHPGWEFYVWLNREENRALFDRAMAEHVALMGRKNRRCAISFPVWYQLVITAADAEIAPPTRVGIGPFDDDPEGTCRCPLGDLIGLNLLSEVSISAANVSGADIICSRQFIGTRRGLLRPHRVILISPKFWRLIEAENVKSVGVEIAHLVQSSRTGIGRG
jgi:hypothetical protein